jgi:hypothetical protein
VTPVIDQSAVVAFWSWFLASEAQIRSAYEAGSAERLDQLISPELAKLSSRLGWELGPYALPKYAFVLAPKSREDLAIARQVAEAAPQMAQWTIYCGKPPKDLIKLIFEVDGAEVCCDDWRYRMTAYNNGEFVDLEIFFEESTAPPNGKEDVLCELLVEALVGQAISLERIGCIDNSEVPDVEQVDRATPMRYLRRHLDDVLSASH